MQTVSLKRFCLNYKFETIEGRFLLFWQPVNISIDIEEQLELLLEENKIDVDSHVFISPTKDFDFEISSYLQYIKENPTYHYDCVNCKNGRDLMISSLPPIKLKKECPVCKSDLILKP